MPRVPGRTARWQVAMLADDPTDFLDLVECCRERLVGLQTAKSRWDQAMHIRRLANSLTSDILHEDAPCTGTLVEIAARAAVLEESIRRNRP